MKCENLCVQIVKLTASSTQNSLIVLRIYLCSCSSEFNDRLAMVVVVVNFYCSTIQII